MKPHYLCLILFVLFALPLRAETIYQGRVLLPDGKAAAGIEVALSLHSNIVDGESGEVPKAVPATVVKTDGNGNWQIKGPELSKPAKPNAVAANSSALLVAFSPQHALAWRTITREDKSPFVLKMKPSDTRRLTVRNEAGQAIAGAKIRLAWLYPRNQNNEDDERPYLSLPDDLAQRWAQPTGADGSLKLSFLPQNMQTTFMVEAPGYATLGRNDYQGEETLLVTLPRPLNVKLRLTAPPDSPLSVASQKLQGSIRGAQPYDYYEVKPQTTDAKGEITLTNIGPGQATFMLADKATDSNGYLGEVDGKFTLSAGEKRDVIELPLKAIRARLVRGKVSSPDGKPLKGAQIYGNGPGRSYDRFLATSDAKGEYAFQAGEGLNNVRIMSAPTGYAPPSGYTPQKFTVEAGEAGQDAATAPNFVLQKASQLKVLVLDTNGKPKPRARIAFNTRDNFFFGNTRRADAKGTLTFSNLSSEQIYIAAREGDNFSERKVLKPPFPSLLTLRLKANGGAKLKGRIFNQLNQPVAGAKVQIVEARERSSSAPTTLTTDKNGHWQSAAFWLDAKFSLFVQAPRHIAAKSAAWQGAAGQTHDFGTLKLTRLDGFVRGIVQNAEGKPQPGAHVWIRGGNSDNLSDKGSSIVTDHNGKFRVDGLSKNALLVFAEKDDLVGAAGRTNPKSDVKITLGRYSSGAPDTTSEKARLEAAKRIAFRHLPECIKQLKARKDKAAQNSLASLVSAVTLIDPARATAFAPTQNEARARFSTASAEQALQQNPPDVTGALARWNGIKDPMYRVYSMISAARKLKQKYPQQARQLLAPALAAARSVPEVSYRTIMLVKLGSLLNNFEAQSGDALLQEATARAKSLGINDYEAYARACVAEEIVATEPETALDLIKPIKDPNEKSRYYGRVSYRMAARDPERAEKLARDNLDEWNQGGTLASLCHALALADLPKAQALADTLKTDNKLRAYRWMIEALAPAHRSEAQNLWRKITSDPASKFGEEYERRQNAVEEIMLIAAGRALGLGDTATKTLQSFGSSAARENSYWSTDEYYNRQELNEGLALYLADANVGRDYLRALVEASLQRIKQVKEQSYYATPLMLAAALSDPKLVEKLLLAVPQKGQAEYLTSLFNFVAKDEGGRAATIKQLLMLGEPYDED